MLDHSASPGIPEAVARRLGLNPKEVSEGKTSEQVTLACSHCPNAWVARPERIRDRGYCRKCDHYICDTCATAMKAAGYVHFTRHDLLNAVMAGRTLDLTTTTVFAPRR